MNKLTIADVRRNNKEAGYFFFSKGTMKFFGSKVESSLYKDNYFITSERFPFNKLRYTIRQYDVNTSEIKTIGDKLYYTKEDARARIKELIKMNKGGI